ncbi:ABC transporter CDR4 [Purpureocillium lavendulum]|uniref:ABC transporter CDR4 n=1 Tax=Purpureocillium lavendulum TaxID=1247861 RepID=A0AB34FRQ3_9HYPO|nr:ABC transporter CDR4 [Purpureocillium lavendulum]
MAEPSPKATPKRKRGQELPITPIKFSFDPSNAQPAEDGGGSPASRVAHRFRGLALGTAGGGGGVNDAAHDRHRDDDDGTDDEAATTASKRQRPDEDMPDITDESASSSSPPSPKDAHAADPNPEPSAARASLPQHDVAIASTETPGRPMQLPIVEDHPKTPGRRRAGTPPLRLKRSPSAKGKDKADEPSVADPVRAALTWHEDEITIYDPNDEDDDGTGINGVGFKPTPALAQVRAMKRRQQMADYRRREESEARARRSQRRRGETPIPSGGGVVKKKSPTRRVRFIDIESQKIAVTTI